MALKLTQRQRRLALVACALAAAFALALWWGLAGRSHDDAAAATVAAGTAAPGQARGVALDAALPLPARVHDLPALRMRLAAGPLAHSTPDGSLPCAGDGLAPSIEVRRRFDWYSQALASSGAADRLDAVEIEALLEQDAKAACGEAAAQQIRTLWRGYTAIAAEVGTRSVDLRARAAALKAAQQAQLGPQWAEAFFGDDHRALQARLGGSTGAATAPASSAAPVPASQSSNAQASAAVAELQARWADFDRRIAEAEREWRALAAQGAATPAQADALLARWFSADERVRASALLNLPG